MEKPLSESLKKIIKESREYETSHGDDLVALSEYSETGRIGGLNFETGQIEWAARPSRSVYLSSRLAVAANFYAARSMTGLNDEAVRVNLAMAVKFEELSFLLRCLQEADFQEAHQRKLASISIRTAQFVGVALAVGFQSTASMMSELLIRALTRGWVGDALHRPVSHLVLRLVCDAKGRQYPLSPVPSNDAVDVVLSEWRNSDPYQLEAALLELCDLRKRREKRNSLPDFLGPLKYYPFDVLTVKRLRKDRGVSALRVNHPNMELPWARLWDGQIADFSDLYQGICERLESSEGVCAKDIYQRFIPSNCLSYSV